MGVTFLSTGLPELSGALRSRNVPATEGRAASFEDWIYKGGKDDDSSHVGSVVIHFDRIVRADGLPRHFDHP
jgi:hypothetical protein